MTAKSEYRWKGGFSTEMTSVMQWDPFTELRATMDRLFEEGFSRPWRFLAAPAYPTAFPVEFWETDEAICLKAMLPGVDPEHVNISVANDVLTIKAEHEDQGTDEQRNYHLREIPYGTYTRSFTLPVSVDADKAEARYEHGMLYLRLPKAEEVRPRQIKISTNGAHALLN